MSFILTSLRLPPNMYTLVPIFAIAWAALGFGGGPYNEQNNALTFGRYFQYIFLHVLQQPDMLNG